MWRLPVSRELLNDVGLTLLFLALGVSLYATGLGVLDENASPLPTWLCLVSLGFASCSQLFRSRHPAIALTGVNAALALDSLTVPSIGVWLVFSDIVYSTCVYGGARLVRVLYGLAAVVAVATFLLVSVVAHDDWRLLFVCVLWLLALIGSPLAYGLAVREHRSALSLEREHSRAMAELGEHEQIEAVADERRRLARELHDVIAGRLSAIAVQSAAALQYPENTALAGKALAAVRASSVEALTEMRGLIDLLSDGSEHSTDGRHTTAGLRRIDRLTEPIAESGTDIAVEIPATITAADGIDALPPVVDIAAFRIVAEALTNAATHAPGQPIRVRITHADDTLVLDICNRLAAHHDHHPTGDRHTGRGLVNMRTRAHAVGGRLCVERGTDEFRVTATLPTTSSDAPRIHP
ncbi:putative two-component histidine kinase [Gordonia polyisoprenivorans NBRC 16320 = JCM 10675]|uniref:histidine kinase n=1 Tax=Gordonia polyisoprenivorans TaxID=84595 RepID=A0A846WGM2_9ACTN|nr:histidine kinase [Gordonia polyisoprenivorans]NKY00912.1 sensor histidine kinase [Gordonia polyisoprenivorans]GAB22581.1 putative two-component histidine kinase [Gordonia polyisoprenivorans NBRC 16320 = JCM 10675]